MSTRHLNQKQLAERWGISPKTLERWRWLGQGPKFLKLGGRIAYRLEDIEAYEQQQLRQVTGSAAAASPTPTGPHRPAWPEQPARRFGRSVHA
ncbi:MAG: helix-turn-helix domain-containing protein [Rhodospirillales bacterium]|nr:helix-turn-helix domain-containing protein [Rhodospirillales bacterium]